LETTSPSKYVELYGQYKQKLAEKGAKKWSQYQVFLAPNIANKLKDFIPTNE